MNSKRTDEAPSAEELSSKLKNQLREYGTRTLSMHEAIAERMGLRGTDHKSLDLAHQASPNQPITAGKLAGLTGLTTGAITGVLDRLERSGFIQRFPGTEDRRQVMVRVVPERSKEMVALFEPLSKAFGELMQQYDAAQLALVSEFIEKSMDIVQRQTERLRSSTPPNSSGDPYDSEAPLHQTDKGQAEFLKGTSSLDLKSAAGDFLYRARFVGTGQKVSASHQGEVSFHAVRSGFGKKHRHGLVELNNSIPWEVAFRGGVSRLRADLSGIQLTGFSIDGGSSDVDVALPAPKGAVPIRMRGGLNHTRFLRPRGTAVRILLRGGATKVSLDRLELGSVGHELRWESPEFEQAEHRYEIELTGGANGLMLAAI